jgi:hypothetical protein
VLQKNTAKLNAFASRKLFMHWAEAESKGVRVYKNIRTSYIIY